MFKKTVAIIGIGRVGLPLALFLTGKGYEVFGIDKDNAKIELLKKGKMPFMEKGAGKILKRSVNKTFFPTTSYDCINKAQILILTLGTPVDPNMNPVYDQIDTAVEDMFPFLQKNQLIILRSTVSPRTTLYIKDKIESKTKFRVGRDIFLAFCPERIAEGNSLAEMEEIPQIIGGTDQKSSSMAEAFFNGLGIKCHVSDSVSAELAKLFTNMYRYITFAIANEFMIIAENFNRNIYEITDLVNKDYKRGGLALPGFSSGPCLFKDGFFLINENPFLDLITASWKVNEAVPLFLIKKIRERTRLKNKKVVILGLAFKPEIDDMRESLSVKLRKAFLRERARVIIHDPYVKDYDKQEISKNIFEDLKGSDVVVFAMRHKFYEVNKTKIAKALSKDTFICDVWNIFGTNKILFRAGHLR